MGQVLALEAVVGAALFDDVGRDRPVEQVAHGVDALAVADVELDLAEGWGELVLHDFDPRAVAEDVVALFEGADSADVEADRCVVLQGVAARGCFGGAENHTDFHAELVDEHDGGASPVRRAR